MNQIYQVEVGKVMQRVTIESIPKPFTDMFDSQLKIYGVRIKSSSDYFIAFLQRKDVSNLLLMRVQLFGIITLLTVCSRDGECSNNNHFFLNVQKEYKKIALDSFNLI